MDIKLLKFEGVDQFNDLQASKKEVSAVREGRLRINLNEQSDEAGPERSEHTAQRALGKPHEKNSNAEEN